MAKKKMTVEEMKARIAEINEDLVALHEELNSDLELQPDATDQALWTRLRKTTGEACELLRERYMYESFVKLGIDFEEI